MDLEITWLAGVTGNHEVCYRLQGTVSYTCQTVFVPAGNNSLIITVPDNFCDDVVYEGYVLAECQGDGLGPDDGTQFSIAIVTKTDPCEPYQIDCDNSPINTLDVSGGTLYQVGDAIMADAVQVGDVNTVDGGGAILTVNFTDFVTTFSAPPVMTIISGAGGGATILAPLTGCIPLVGSCDGANNSGVPTPTIRPNIPVGESFYLCSEVLPTPAPAGQFTVTSLLGPGYETCHCEGCVEMEVSNPTEANLYIYYTHLDPILGTVIVWQQIIQAGASNVNLTNTALEDSVSWDAGLVVVLTPCPLPA